MTILGQMLVEDGIKKGRELGRSEGRQEGRQEGLQEGRQEGIELTRSVLQLFAQGESAEAISVQLNLPIETVEQILSVLP